MAGRTQHLAFSILIAHVCVAGGCSTLRVAMDTLARKGEVIEEAHLTRAQYRADMHEARMAQKLADIECHLHELNQLACTRTETTLAMEMTQGLDIQDISVDVDELKNVIARAEARARAEDLRRQRLPGLLREQQEAFGGEGFGSTDQPRTFEQVAYDGTVMQAADEADIVVGIDQCGDPLPFCEEGGPKIGPSDIPYVVRMKIHVGLENPRLEKSRLKRHPGCGLPDCYGKGCSDCAAVTQLDQQLMAAVQTSPQRNPPADNYMAVREQWLNEADRNPPRSHQIPALDATRVAATRLPAKSWPTPVGDGRNTVADLKPVVIR